MKPKKKNRVRSWGAEKQHCTSQILHLFHAWMDFITQLKMAEYKSFCCTSTFNCWFHFNIFSEMITIINHCSATTGILVRSNWIFSRRKRQSPVFADRRFSCNRGCCVFFRKRGPLDQHCVNRSSTFDPKLTQPWYLNTFRKPEFFRFDDRLLAARYADFLFVFSVARFNATGILLIIAYNQGIVSSLYNFSYSSYVDFWISCTDQ